MPWNSIASVSSALTLVAFIIATGAWLYKNSLLRKERLIRQAPESERPELIQNALEGFNLNTKELQKKLTREQLYNLAMKQLHDSAMKFRITAVIVAFIALLAAGISIFALIPNPTGEEQTDKSQSNTNSASNSNQTPMSTPVLTPANSTPKNSTTATPVVVTTPKSNISVPVSGNSSSTPSIAPTPTPIWEKTIAGEWENTGNGLIQKNSSSTPARIIAKNPNKHFYVVSFQARCITDGEFGINFNYQNEQNFAEWAIGNSYRGSNMNGVEGGKSLIQIAVPDKGVLVFQETAKPSSLMVGRWYNVRVVVDGINMKGYIDDELKIDFTLPNYASQTGTFCLRTWATVAEFKNIKVE
jgi:hypothetical protein